jgi:uncharacterized protein (DUF433 family)
MATTKRLTASGEASDGDDDLIATHIEIQPHRPDPEEARVVGHGYPVWILVDALVAADHDLARVARDYELPEEAVRAAVAFYDRHRAAIDARIRANAAVYGAYA